MRFSTFSQIIFTVLMAFLSSPVVAQSNGDNLFMEGQKLQQSMSIASQNQAIKKFKAARVVYTTKEKKKMCDNQISICNNNIASIKKGAKRKQAEEEQPETAPVRLSIQQKLITVNYEKVEEVEVAVVAASKAWDVQPMESGSQFVSILRGRDSTKIRLKVLDNELTIERQQSFIVSLGDERDTLVVTQKGKPVFLSLSSNLMEFRLKGGNKALDISTNSDSIVTSNDGLTWHVESKPDWIEVNIDYETEKRGFAKSISAIKRMASSQPSTPEGMKTTKLKILAVPLMKSDPEYQSGRRGEIIFASQDKRYKVIVIQQK